VPHVIAAPCLNRKAGSCHTACPVDAIHPTPKDPDWETAEQLYIDPVSCIDCGACIPECPVEAIWRDDELPDQWSPFVSRNSTYYTAR
jgi:NAD-dependent dihydropyrimidine dehydrogenase PreA subunit